MRKYALVSMLVTVAATALPAAAAGKAKTAEERLKLAREYVARSDRYFSHDKLRRGMTGYGLTVMAGSKIEKFRATVVSVMENWTPRHAVILCRLEGLNLDKTGVIAGMSGSPVFIKDPADGKDKMIGAVAYGWDFQNTPICGIQPIAQMLAVAGCPLPGAKPCVVEGGSFSGAAGGLDPAFVDKMLDPAKHDFSAPVGAKAAGNSSTCGMQMKPLSTPLMLSGLRPRTLSMTEKLFRGTGMVPLQAGGAGAAEAADADTRLVPGAALAVALVEGDADLSAVGTVTDVLGDGKGGQYVLAFGHPFNADGKVDLPMGPAYVHAVISSAQNSFKLGSTLKITGRLSDDEKTGVGGQIGAKARMIPMTVTVQWGDDVQTFHYRLVRHNWLTATMASIVMKDSLWSNRDLPELHTVDYTVDIDFGKYGRYHAANRSSTRHAVDVSSDLTRPLAAMMNAEVGEPVFPDRIDVRMNVYHTQATASVMGLELARHTYRPGETVRGKAVIRPFRSQRVTRDVAIKLPDDIAEGAYTLTACDSEQLLQQRKQEMPQRFEAHNVAELFDGLREVVGPRTNRLYVHVPLTDGGVAVRRTELDHMPPSLANVLARTAPMDTRHYVRSLDASVATEYVLNGSASADFTVQKEPDRNH